MAVLPRPRPGRPVAVAQLASLVAAVVAAAAQLVPAHVLSQLASLVAAVVALAVMVAAVALAMMVALAVPAVPALPALPAVLPAVVAAQLPPVSAVVAAAHLPWVTVALGPVAVERKVAPLVLLVRRWQRWLVVVAMVAQLVPRWHRWLVVAAMVAQLVPRWQRWLVVVGPPPVVWLVAERPTASIRQAQETRNHAKRAGSVHKPFCDAVRPCDCRLHEHCKSCTIRAEPTLAKMGLLDHHAESATVAPAGEEPVHPGDPGHSRLLGNTTSS